MEILKEFRNLSKDVRAKRKAYYTTSVLYQLVKLNMWAITPIPVFDESVIKNDKQANDGARQAYIAARDRRRDFVKTMLGTWLLR